MARSCPISSKQIDGTIARINAVFITLLIIIFLLTSNTIILYFLAIDFLLRLSNYKSWSLIFIFSTGVKKLFTLKTKMTDAAAKKLAALFGLVFIVVMIIFTSLDLDIALYITAAILLYCTSLEVLFNYCVGCEIYHIFKKINHKRV